MSEIERSDDPPKQAEWMTCEHHWVYSSQPDMPILVGRCSQCGHYNGPDIEEQIEDIADRIGAQFQDGVKRLREENESLFRAICMVMETKCGGRVTFSDELLVRYPRDRMLVLTNDLRTFSTIVEVRVNPDGAA